MRSDISSRLISYCVRKKLILLKSLVSRSRDYKAIGDSGFREVLSYLRAPRVSRNPGPSWVYVVSRFVDTLERVGLVLVSGNNYLKILLLLHNDPTGKKPCLIFRYFIPDTKHRYENPNLKRWWRATDRQPHIRPKWGQLPLW